LTGRPLQYLLNCKVFVLITCISSDVNKTTSHKARHVQGQDHHHTATMLGQIKMRNSAWLRAYDRAQYKQQFTTL